jgi:hypothetical protein
MELSSKSRWFAVAALCFASLCLFAFGVSGAEGRDRAKVRSAIALDGGAAKGKCRKLAARRSRSAAARAKRPATARRISRHVRSRVLRRCSGRRAKPSVLPTQVGGRLIVGIDGGYAGWSDTEIEERAALGAAITRHEWDPAEPVDDQDEEMEVAAGQIHTRIHALLGANRLPPADQYRQWVLEFIGRYGLGGSFWDAHPELDEQRYAITSVELGNEPYFGEMSADEYADTVRPVLEEIQRLNLPVTVVLPSRVYGSNTSWMDALYERIPNLNDLFDAFAEHPYWYGHDPAEVDAAGPFGRIETARLRMNEHGANTKPIWITEYGESTAECGEECVSEEVQAQHLRQMLDAVVTRSDWGIRMISVFQLRDRGTDQSDREREFGLLRQDGSAKPSYGIVQSAIQAYRG